MAHPGIWGLAGLSAALIAAGVWLNRPDRAEFSFRAGGPEPGQVSPEAELRRETPAEATTDPVVQPVEAGPIAEPAPEPIAEPGSEPSPVVDLPPKDDLPPPAPVDAEPAVSEPPAPPAEQALSPDPTPTPEPASEPRHEPAPEVAPLAEAAEADAAAGTDRPAQAATEDSTDGPLIFTGADIWLLATTEDVAPEAIAEATRIVDARHSGPLAYSAIAVSRAQPDVVFMAQGYNELGRAEAHALALCRRSRTDCVILAWRVPEDWDGSYEGTLGSRQRAAWDAFNLRPPGNYRAFAISAEGATGQADGETADTAHIRALAECVRDQDRIRRPGVTAGHCRIVALRDPATGPSATPLAIRGGPEGAPETDSRVMPGTDQNAAEPATPSRPTPEGMMDAPPAFYHGEAVWELAAAAETLDENLLSRTLNAAERQADGARFFGAIAFSRSPPVQRFLTNDQIDMETAEEEALRLCHARAEDCAIMARRVPRDWDGRRVHSLSQSQTAAWEAFVAPPSGSVVGRYRALALSINGGSGLGEAEQPLLARNEAMASCRRDIERLSLTERNRTGCFLYAIGGPMR